MVCRWGGCDHDHDHDAHLGVSLEFGGELGWYVDGVVGQGSAQARHLQYRTTLF